MRLLLNLFRRRAAAIPLPGKVAPALPPRLQPRFVNAVLTQARSREKGALTETRPPVSAAELWMQNWPEGWS